MKDNVRNQLPLALALLPWLVIFISGTIGFVRLEGIQNTLRNQVKTNEELRLDGSAILNKSLLKQCLEEYKIDGKLSILGKDLLSSQILDEKSKNSLSDFSLEVKKDQDSLNCSGPNNKEKTVSRIR